MMLQTPVAAVQLSNPKAAHRRNPELGKFVSPVLSTILHTLHITDAAPHRTTRTTSTDWAPPDSTCPARPCPPYLLPTTSQPYPTHPRFWSCCQYDEFRRCGARAGATVWITTLDTTVVWERRTGLASYYQHADKRCLAFLRRCYRHPLRSWSCPAWV